MTPRTATRRSGARAPVVLGALAVALGLGACSAVGDPSAAALVDGEVVATPADVATILEEFPLELAGGQAPPPGQIVSFLALDGPVRELAIQTETPVVDQGQARDWLAEADEAAGREPVRYSEPMLRLIATNLTVNAIGQDQENAPLIQAMVSDLGDRLEVNPRYGAVDEDGDGLVVPVEHPWLVSSDA